MSFEQDFIFPVYIEETILNQIKKLAASSELEIFGYLIGEILKWENNIYLVIENQLFIENAVHSHKFTTSQIEGTAGKYDKEFKKLKLEKGNESLRVVGWWHSHPGYGCFLSTTDIHTQEFFFPESYQVALVIDPVRKEFKFFTLEKASNHKYREISFAVIST